MKPLRRTITGLTVLLGASSFAGAATVQKANNTDNLVLGSSWVGGSPPDGTGTAKWDGTVTSANTTAVGADLTWGSINIADPAGPVSIQAGNTLTNNGRFGMEIKNPNGTGLDNGDGSIVIENNTVSFSARYRRLKGRSVAFSNSS